LPFDVPLPDVVALVENQEEAPAGMRKADEIRPGKKLANVEEQLHRQLVQGVPSEHGQSWSQSCDFGIYN
jgi:hypothetical protein